MKKFNDTCPNCGYCPHCGMGTGQRWPYWNYPYTYPYRFWYNGSNGFDGSTTITLDSTTTPMTNTYMQDGASQMSNSTLSVVH